MTDIDVLCLQEIWSPDDRQAFIDRLAPVFPHAHFENTTNASLFPDAEAEPAACTDMEAQPLADCARPACSGNPDITSCVLSECGDLFSALSAQCQECAASNIGLGDVDEILAVCTTEGAIGYSYDGQNGLLLLSKTPIEEKRYAQLDSFLIARGVLFGQTNGVDVACTHLSAALSDPVYNGPFDSYAAENAAQIQMLFTMMTSEDARPQVLVGDFNTGPDVGGLAGSLPDNYDLFADQGWSNPNIELEMPLCTWCAENLIVSGTRNRAIDHIFVRGTTATDVARVLDGPLELVTMSDEPIVTSYSDHYGIAVSISVQP